MNSYRRSLVLLALLMSLGGCDEINRFPGLCYRVAIMVGLPPAQNHRPLEQRAHMGKRIPVGLSNGRHWEKRGDALAHFKLMLNRYRNGQVVNDPADHSDLVALVTAYEKTISDKTKSKVGPGIKHFSRESNLLDGYPTDGFHVHRVDGSSIDFSYIKAVQRLG